MGNDGNIVMNILNKIIQYGILLFIFLIPWQARLMLVPGSINGEYWEYGTQSLYATEALLFIVLIAIIARVMVAIRQKTPSFSVRTLYSPLGMLAVLVAWSGLSIIWSHDRSVGLEHWTMLIEAGVVFLIVSSRVVPFNNVLWAIIFSGFVQATIGIAQSFLQIVPASTFFGMAHQSADMLGASVVETAQSRWLRPYGTFSHPNILGGWLALSLMSVAAATRSLVVESRGAKDRTTIMRFAIRYLVFVVALFGLLATYSRSAWIAACAGLAIFIVVSAKEKVFRSYAFVFVGIGIAVVILFGLMFPDQLTSRIIGQNRLEIKSSQERGASLAQSWDVLSKNRLLGTGIGNYGLAVHDQLDANQPAYYYQPVHNIPLLVLAELGIIGGIVITGFFLSFFRRHPERSDSPYSARNGVEGYNRLSAGVFLLPFIIIALFDHYLWSVYSGMMMGAVYMGIFWLKLGKS